MSIRRLFSDLSGTHCLHVSLGEAATALGLQRKDLSRVLPDSVISPADYFDAIIDGSVYLGMNVSRILASQLLIDNPHVSISERARTLLITSNDDYMLACPNIRLMFRDNGKTFDCHAECDDNSNNSLRRIEQLEQRGWFTGAMAEIRRK